MPRKHTASFILELPLKTDSGDERACAIILDAGRNIGNAVLGEGLRRLDLMRESRAYRAARKMSRGEPRCPERKARANEFKRLFEGFGFTGHALQKFAQGCRDKCRIRDHLPGHGAQTAVHADHREAGDGVALAVLPVSRAPKSGEAPRWSLWPRG
jgi:putative transposase